MKLTVKERILLLQVLPKEGDFLTQKIVKDLQGAVGLAESDWKKYDIKTTAEGRVQWNPDKDIGQEIEIGEKATSIVQDALKEMDKQKKVTTEFMILFDKFLPDFGKEKK